MTDLTDIQGENAVSYENLASVYDVFMDNVEYDSWCSCLVKILCDAGIRDGLVCELGCGTGDMTERLARAGYDMIGIDVSEEMLGVAQKKELLRKHPELREEKADQNRGQGEYSELQTEEYARPYKQEADACRQIPDILYLQQDMREFELYGTVRAVVSVCDSLNYLTEEEDLLQVFRLVNNYLDPGGLFLFDMNTPACYEAIGDQTIAENRPEGSFIWENTYDPETQCNEYDLTLFLPVTESREKISGISDEAESTAECISGKLAEEGCAAGCRAGDSNEADHTRGETAGEEVLYIKREEYHLQRGYTAETVCRLLEKAGLEVLSVTEAYTGQEASEETERLLYAAREIQKSYDD